jgi:hypothetical protein
MLEVFCELQTRYITVTFRLSRSYNHKLSLSWLAVFPRSAINCDRAKLSTLSFMMASFEFTFSFGFAWSSSPAREDSTKRPVEPMLRPPQTDTRESELSPATLKLQQEIRHRARRSSEYRMKSRRPREESNLERRHKQHIEAERLVDAESLYLLEAAEAACSKLAKIKDRESLEVLMRHTAVKKRRQPAAPYSTPQQKSFWPPFRRFKRTETLTVSGAGSWTTPSDVKKAHEARGGHVKGLNGTPRSYAPSSSTQSSLRNEVKLPAVDNEFEDFLAKSVPSSQEDGSGKRRRSSSFSALLRSVKATEKDVASGKMLDSAHVQQQARSMFKLMEKVGKRDEDEDESDDSYSVVEDESPIISPTLEIKHHDRASGEESRKENSEVIKPKEDEGSKSPGEDSAGEEPGIQTPPSGELVRGDEQWEVLDD